MSSITVEQQGAIIEAVIDMHSSFSVGDISSDPEVRRQFPTDRGKLVRGYLDQMVIQGILVKTGKRWYSTSKGHQW